MLRLKHSEHEEILELAAQHNSEGLEQKDYARLRAHIEQCESCREIADEYKLLTDYGRALRTSRNCLPSPESLWDHEQQKSALLARLHSTEERPDQQSSFWQLRRLALLQIGVAALVLLILGATVGYRVGATRTPPRQAATRPAGPPPSNERSDRNQQELRDAAQQVAASQQEIDKLTKAVESLSLDRETLVARADELSAKLGMKAESTKSLEKERDDIAGRLNQTEQQLHSVQQELQKAQDDRSRILLRVATAEFKAQQLSAQLGEKDETIARQQQYLESDRDIRELMGARQLYIADVVDVDRDGKNRKPFGRVFYTKGKSLVFYGFDLDQQPGIRNASVFQVWGHSDANERRPVNLGIFYLDNETNHRWVLKADNSELLSQLDAVFVTVEKNRESKQPSSKPFLYTYLRKGAPNHP